MHQEIDRLVEKIDEIAGASEPDQWSHTNNPGSRTVRSHRDPENQAGKYQRVRRMIECNQGRLQWA